MAGTCKVQDCTNLTAWQLDPRKTAGGYFKGTCDCCRNLISKYGITTPERNQMLKEQNNECLICNTQIKFSGQVSKGSTQQGEAHVDHCHTTGKLRGILCAQCNLDLGKYETLKPKFNAFANYVEEYGHVG